jgi:hypothetical protein
MLKIKLAGVYKISYKDYYYIGYSVDIFSRWSSHYVSILTKKHSSVEFVELFGKTRITDWTFTILEKVSKTEFKKNYNLKGKSLEDGFRKFLIQRERYWMSLHSVNFCLNKDKKYFNK